MPPRHTTHLQLHLTPPARRTLEAWLRRTTIAQCLAKRARIIVLLDAGVQVTRIALMVDISRRHVYKWAKRYLAQGVAGLVDLPKGPRPRRGEDEA